MLFGIHANESSPCSLRINGILQGRGSFLGSECFTYCLAIYLRAHPDKGGIREVRTAERIRTRMCVFLAALLCGQEDLEALSMSKYIVTQECEQAPIPA